MQIYDVPELSRALKVSEKAVRSYLISGRLKGRKVGKRWLVHEDAVREFLMNIEPIVTEQ
ncbi:MAG: Helix-turn-helix domain [Acidobacteria bacterium]|jgi:excisionase family DNA binding protein|nr:Helix-turn-helix domain [Acidobacteriota bacterium]